MRRPPTLAAFPALTWLLPALVAAALYVQVHDHTYIDFDDMHYTYENPMVAQGLTVEGISWAFTEAFFANYHPLTWISHMVDFEIFGNNPGAFALENAVLHAANAALVALLFVRLMRSRWIGLVVGIVFAVHPQLVEAVAWISQRKTLLATLCALGSMHLYLRSVSLGGTKVRSVPYALSIGLFVLSLLAKGMYVTLPAILVLLELVAASRRSGEAAASFATWLPALNRRAVVHGLLRLAPFLALAMASAVATVWAQAGYGAVQSVEALPLSTRVATALTSILAYVRQFLVPTGFSIYYPRPDSIDAWSVACAAAVFIAVTWATLRMARSVDPAPLLGWLLFLICLLPVSGLIQVGDQARADRYMYGPVLGLLLMGASLVGLAARKLADKKLRHLCASALVGWTILTALLGFRQVSFWYSSYSIGLSSEASVGPAPQLVGLRATALLRARKYKSAIRLYREILESTPDHLLSLNNLALAELRIGNTDTAIALCKRHIELAPEIGRAYANLALAYARAGRFTEAQETMAEAERLRMVTLSTRQTFASVRAILDHKVVEEAPLDSTE